MMTAAMKRARLAWAIVMAMRVAGNKEGEGSTGCGIGNKGGHATKRAMATAASMMATRVTGKQQQRGLWQW